MQDVTPENFLAVLKGDSSSVKGGSGKVLKRQVRRGKQESAVGLHRLQQWTKYRSVQIHHHIHSLRQHFHMSCTWRPQITDQWEKANVHVAADVTCKSVVVQTPVGSEVAASVRIVEPKLWLKSVHLSGVFVFFKTTSLSVCFGSGPNDHVFVYFTDHGAPGILAFPDDEVSFFFFFVIAGHFSARHQPQDSTQELTILIFFKIVSLTTPLLRGGFLCTFLEKKKTLFRSCISDCSVQMVEGGRLMLSYMIHIIPTK